MPPNNSPQDLITWMRSIELRLSWIENVSQLGNSSIQKGALQILDPLGRLVASLGIQADGTIGLTTFDPTSGAKVLDLGQQADGTAGLALFDRSGTKQVQIGQQPGGLYGLSIRNTATGVDQLVAGTTAQSVIAAQTTSSTTSVTFSDDPTVTETIGSSGQAEVTFGCTIGTGGDNDQGIANLTVDGVDTPLHASVSSSAPGAGVQASVSKTEVVSGLSPGSHTFSLSYQCLTGVHGISVSHRFVAVSPF